MKRAVSLLMVFLLCLPSIVAFAQDDTDEEIEFVDFESENGLFEISYPEDWILIEELLDVFIVVVSSSDELFNPESPDLEPQTGDTLVTILLLSEETVAPLGMDLPDPELTPEEIMAYALDNIIDPYNGLNSEQLEEDEVEIGEVELIELDEDREVGTVAIKQPGTESLNFAYYMGDVMVIASVAIFDAEIADVQDIVLQILASFQFNGTTEDLLSF